MHFHVPKSQLYIQYDWLHSLAQIMLGTVQHKGSKPSISAKYLRMLCPLWLDFSLVFFMKYSFGLIQNEGHPLMWYAMNKPSYTFQQITSLLGTKGHLALSKG